MRKFIFVASFLTTTFLFTKIVQARLLPRAVPQKSQSTSSVSTTSLNRVVIQVKFRPDRLGIIATFTNLSVASSVSYTLTYNSRGTTQGAGGSIALPASEPIVRELLFGTCSHGVCRFDTGITNAQLVVTTTLKNGSRVVKTFKLKV